MNIIYNAGIHAYALAARLAACRSPKVRAMLRGQAQAVAHVAEVRRRCAPGGFDLWFHAASLGEFEQARPLIEMYRRLQPQLKMLLTFFSPSGYEVRKNYDKVDCVAYLPFDKPALVTQFLDAAKPRKAIFVKYEFWGNYLSQLRQRGIPVYLIDAIFRPGQIFFRRGGGQFRDILRCYRHIFVQDEASKALLAKIGIDNVTVAGDTRFDRVTDVKNATVDLPAIQQWLGGGAEKPFVLIAGSSWQPDEQHYLPWLNAHSDVKAIIAPHEFDTERLHALMSQIKGKTQLWSQVMTAASGQKIMTAASGQKSDAGKYCAIDSATQVLIIDSFGLLSSLYRFGTVALVGGGFGAGIHNINEAAVYGIPVVFGPNHRKFKEAADLIACGGANEYTDSATLAAILDTYKNDPAALTAAGHSAAAYIAASLGATPAIYQAIN